MRFRFIRPLHGWHEFIHEIIIVVIGVLLALAGAQAIEDWRWQSQVRSTRRSIATELATAATQGAERISIEDCQRNRIGELAGKLHSSNGRWAADPMPGEATAIPIPHWDVRSFRRIYSVPLVGWSQDAWDTAKSSGVVDHMSHDEVASYSDIYGAIAAIRQYQDDELKAEASLSYLSTDQQIDNGSKIEALGKLGQLDALNSVNAGLSSLIMDEVGALHLDVDRSRFDKELQETLAGERRYYGACVKDVQLKF